MTRKKTYQSLGLIYLLALGFSLIGRLDLLILDSQNQVTYHYIAKGGVPTLTKLLSIFTGAQLLSLLLSFVIIGAIYAMTCFILSQATDRLRLIQAGGVGLVNVLVSLGVMVIFFVKSLSPLQLRAMKSSGNLGLVLVLILLCLTTLFAAKVMVLRWAGQKSARVVGGLLLSTIPSAIITGQAFAAFNQLVVDSQTLKVFLLIGLAYNVLLAVFFNRLTNKASQ